MNTTTSHELIEQRKRREGPKSHQIVSQYNPQMMACSSPVRGTRVRREVECWRRAGGEKWSAGGERKGNWRSRGERSITGVGIAALDFPDCAVKEITFIFLSMRVDHTIKCCAQKTARSLRLNPRIMDFLKCLIVSIIRQKRKLKYSTRKFLNCTKS